MRFWTDTCGVRVGVSRRTSRLAATFPLRNHTQIPNPEHIPMKISNIDLLMTTTCKLSRQAIFQSIQTESPRSFDSTYGIVDLQATDTIFIHVHQSQ